MLVLCKEGPCLGLSLIVHVKCCQSKADTESRTEIILVSGFPSGKFLLKIRNIMNGKFLLTIRNIMNILSICMRVEVMCESKLFQNI